jgi:glycosyltransferase involved in cell wall biosynthesis
VNSARPARLGAARLGVVVGQLSTGGAEGQLWQVVRSIDRTRFEPVVYCLSPRIHPIGERLRNEGVRVHVTPAMGWRRVPWLARALAADAIDVVHAWLYIANAFTGAVSLFDRSRPMITSARNCKVQGRASQVANVLAFRRSRAIVVNSREVAAYIARRYWAPQNRIRVIYNGIDTQRFHPSECAANGKATPGPIVTVGRLVAQKNHELFLRAAATLAQELEGARFIIVGAGPRRAALEAQAHTLGIADRVSFAGERQDVETVLQTAALFWLTSRWEGLPNVALEAMASGVPVIATDVGGTRELIRSGVDGFVVPAQDHEGFVRHSRDLLCDAGRRRQFAVAARTRAEAFSSTRMVDGLSQLYDEVLAQDA